MSGERWGTGPGPWDDRRSVGRPVTRHLVHGKPVELDDLVLRRLAESGLLEDGAWHDITTDPLVPDDQQGRAAIVAKAQGVLAGLPVARAVFAAADGALRWTELLADGALLSPGDRVAALEGSVASILRAERLALNYLCHLSGIATTTAAVARLLRGTDCRVRDTRKTIPGLRTLQKYAVHVGGGINHRLSLADGVLIKDNHLAALRARGLDIAVAVRLARQANPHLRIEVEVTSVTEAREAVVAGADELLLDNMSLKEMRETVAMVDGLEHPPALEASGGITLANAREVAETGVDYISIGALTHSARALDMSLELEG